MNRRPMLTFGRLALVTVALMPLLTPAAMAEMGRKAAIFTAELDDPMLPYGRKPPPAFLKRLDLITDELRKTLVDKGKLESVDLAPQAEEIKKQAPLFKCNGCVPDIAKALGADYAVTTVAEKGGPQLFNLSVTIVEVASGKVVRKGIVVINANSDDDWAHAARSVVKNRLLAEPLPNPS